MILLSGGVLDVEDEDDDGILIDMVRKWDL